MSSLVLWGIAVAVALLLGELLYRKHQTGTRLWGDFTQMLAGITYFVLMILLMFTFGVLGLFIGALFGGLYWALFRTKLKDFRGGLAGAK